MAVITIAQFRKRMQKRIDNLKKVGIKTEDQASRFMMFTAKKLAPRSSGKTIQGIRRKKKGAHYVVESRVPGRFKQNFFANQTAPFRTLRFTKGNKAYAFPQKVVYGKPAISSSGNAIQWTGTPRFFHFAFLRARPFMKTMAKRNTSKAVRVTT